MNHCQRPFSNGQEKNQPTFKKSKNKWLLGKMLMQICSWSTKRLTFAAPIDSLEH